MMADASFIIGEEVSVMVRINVSVCLSHLYCLYFNRADDQSCYGGKTTASSNNIEMFPQVQVGASI